MKKHIVFVLALVLAVSLLTACGCTNSNPANTDSTTLPPTTGATIMPTTEATTMPTTMATTAPTTEAPTSMPTDGSEHDTVGTEDPTDHTGNTEISRRMPAPNGK